jgi:chaperonin cofactor prefoldin
MKDGAATAPQRAELLTIHHQRVEAQIHRLQNHLTQIRSKINIYDQNTPWSPPAPS